MKILVTGAAGYIGSHTCVALLAAGHRIVALDNLSNSKIEVFSKIKQITGADFPFYTTDLLDTAELEAVFAAHKFDCVMHFAAFKSVPQSVSAPLEYYKNNVCSTINLCEAMQKHNVTKMVYSSSATVYRSDNPLPLTEDAALGASNPYGWSKIMCEQILSDIAAAQGWSVVHLRYFNPVGAHESGILSEDPLGTPGNLMPLIIQVARGLRPALKIAGTDYETPDGTGVRDYIHVADVARGHLNALDYAAGRKGCEAFNLGTGNGVSVLEMLETFKKVNKINVPCETAPRRPGDIAAAWCDPTKARQVLGFKALRDLEEMCRL